MSIQTVAKQFVEIFAVTIEIFAAATFRDRIAQGQQSQLRELFA